MAAVWIECTFVQFVVLNAVPSTCSTWIWYLRWMGDIFCVMFVSTPRLLVADCDLARQDEIVQTYDDKYVSCY